MNRPDEDQLGAACFEADLIDARHVRVIRTQVSEIGCKWVVDDCGDGGGCDCVTSLTACEWLIGQGIMFGNKTCISVFASKAGSRLITSCQIS